MRRTVFEGNVDAFDLGVVTEVVVGKMGDDAARAGNDKGGGFEAQVFADEGTDSSAVYGSGEGLEGSHGGGYRGRVWRRSGSLHGELVLRRCQSEEQRGVLAKIT